MLDQMTREEKEAWEYVRIAANRVLALPEEHPMEREEACHAFHQIQHYLLARNQLRDMWAESEAIEAD